MAALTVARVLRLTIAALAGGIALGPTARAAERRAAGRITLAAEESWDGNVFRMAQGPLRNVESRVTTGTVRWEGAMRGVALTYGLEAVGYSGVAATENHVRQTFGGAGHGAWWAADWDWNAQWLVVDGADVSPRFGGGRNCFAITAPRERRDQTQIRTALAGTWRWGREFVRVVGGLTDYDLRTDRQAGPGVDNYVDRSDRVGGVDGGWRSGQGNAFFIGYRWGGQRQDRDGGKLSDRTNRYERVLVGCDGRVVEKLRLTVQLGPERHRYRADSVGPGEIERLWVDASATWQVAKGATLQGGTKRLQAVASTGTVSSQDITHFVQGRMQLAARWSATLGVRRSTGIYDGAVRDDELLSGTCAVAWRPRTGGEFTLTYLNEAGRDRTGVKDATREFHRAVVGLEAGWEF